MIEKKNSVCVIGVYFGKLPEYFDLWLKSCEYNPEIDFLIFTDQTLTDLPNNVKQISTSLLEVKTLAEEKMQMQVCLERPYKLCDFKPIYGLIFSDYIKEYEYWGHCDFDLIFGRIMPFLEKYDYKKYDRFLDLGHLSFYRNTDTVNHYYKSEGAIIPYTQTFSNDKITVFDEFQLNKIYDKNGYPFFKERLFADISVIYKRFRLALNDKNYSQQVFFWEDGHVYRSYMADGEFQREEFMYIHFKKRNMIKQSDDVASHGAFYIGPKGFTVKTGEVTLDSVKQINKYKGACHEKNEKFWFDFRKFFERLKKKLTRN